VSSLLEWNGELIPELHPSMTSTKAFEHMRSNFRIPSGSLILIYSRVLSSIHNNARQSEAHFSTLKLAAKGQNNVYDIFHPQLPSNSITKRDGGRPLNGG